MCIRDSSSASRSVPLSGPERGTERDAEETEKVLMRTSQKDDQADVI